MTAYQLKRRLAHVNLSKLARLSQIDVRTLRDIRNSEREPKPEMIERLEPFVNEAAATLLKLGST